MADANEAGMSTMTIVVIVLVVLAVVLVALGYFTNVLDPLLKMVDLKKGDEAPQEEAPAPGGVVVGPVATEEI